MADRQIAVEHNEESRSGVPGFRLGTLGAFWRSLGAAFDGLVYVIKSEPNARIHLVIAVLALLLGVVLGLSDDELAAIFFAVIIVFIAEVVNTALEKTLNLIKPEYNDQVKIVKDIAAGAVLVAAVGAFAVGIAIFLPHIVGESWRN